MEQSQIEVFVAQEIPEEIVRSVELTNMQWLVISQSLEAFAGTFRTQQSQLIATLVTRGQLQEAVEAARKMNTMLQELDKVQAAVM